MSSVDTSFTPEERERLKFELRRELTAFISAATEEKIDPVLDVSNLLNLPRKDIRRVALVHSALSDSVRTFTRHLSRDLRAPVTNTDRPRQVSQSVRGPIDWSATSRYTMNVGLSTAFVIRPALRVFDTPENRALVWALDQLDSTLRGIPTTEGGAATTDHDWVDEVVHMRSIVESARTHYWLRGLPAERPTRQTLSRLAASRSSFYAIRLRDVIALLQRLENDPSSEELLDMLLERYFVPKRDWKLYEILIALRVSRRIEALATTRGRRLLEGVGRVPYATFELPGGNVRLWYQSWPPTSGPSAQNRVIKDFRVQAEGTRPDIIVEIERKSGMVQGVLLEVKASKRGPYIGEGITQILGYLRDRPLLFGEGRVAAVVAPQSSAFRDADPLEDAEIAVASGETIADWVVEAVAERFA